MTERPKRGRSIPAAIGLAVAGLALAWLCVRVTALAILPADAPVLAAIAPDAPDRVLSRYMRVAVLPEQRLTGSDIARVRQVAARVPLDDRPFYLLGRQAAPERVLPLLEAGQQLNPRRRLTNAYLLDRYARAGDYAKAAQQLSVLSRLVGEARDPIANVLVLMASDAQTQPVVRRVLQGDPNLEQLVLVALARSGGAPELILGLASPRAMDTAGAAGNWGPALVARLVESGEYGQARDIWQRIYNVEATSGLIFNPDFAELSAAPPFNWTLVAGSLGAADARGGELSIDYYGRDTGDLAYQTLLLEPGSYRFSFVTQGGTADSESQLFWQLFCTSGQPTPLMSVEVPASPAARRIATTFSVPADCPAQNLRLHGQTGEFPDNINTVVRDLTLQRSGSGAE